MFIKNKPTKCSWSHPAVPTWNSLTTCFQEITHTCSSRSKLRRWYLCQVMKAGPLCEKSMALNGRPGPAGKQKTHAISAHHTLRDISILYHEKVIVKVTVECQKKSPKVKTQPWASGNQQTIRLMWQCSFTQKSVADRIIVLPDEEIIDGDVGDLGLSPVWSQQSQPVLGGNDVVWVGGGLSQLQGVEELLELLGGQGVDVLPHHGSFPLVTVWSGPTEFTLTTVMPCKVTFNAKSKLNVSNHFGADVIFQVHRQPSSDHHLNKTVHDSPVHLHVWLKNLVGHLSLSSTFLSLYGPPQGLLSTRTAEQFPLPDREPHTLAGSEPRAGQHCLDRIPSTVQHTRGNWASAASGQRSKQKRPRPSAFIIFHQFVSSSQWRLISFYINSEQWNGQLVPPEECGIAVCYGPRLCIFELDSVIVLICVETTS